MTKNSAMSVDIVYLTTIPPKAKTDISFFRLCTTRKLLVLQLRVFVCFVSVYTFFR